MTTMTPLQTLLAILIMALVTLATRALPFILFPAGRPTPRYVVYLGKVLPFAITAMLVVYCLKDVRLTAAPFGLPELIALVVVAGLFLWRKNSLLAIAAGTVLYMVLVQAVFI
ncbi:AzlD domain-containing protein [Ruminococcaceae bacterium OttesenSCG-928-D13]|nr:AzlD domain-containing protein [Ruminococcaceae bacterium OttesenSCG-928-D13]